MIQKSCNNGTNRLLVCVKL
ncbi:hypothetical protein Goari_023696 [Gossypium aridum]|uniref:Uncharacterized protein n=1 Tax=Gossypium aridum TaxID=34290 RepID=A0A7J8X545_GOSAI|nr:hypothetical protein [Gossypium aridum]